LHDIRLKLRYYFAGLAPFSDIGAGLARALRAKDAGTLMLALL